MRCLFFWTAALLLLALLGCAAPARPNPAPAQPNGVPAQPNGVPAQPNPPAPQNVPADGGAGPARAPVSPVSLTGDWLGPMPNGTGACGNSYSEFMFATDGHYSVTSNSQNCGGFTTFGVYEVQGQTLYFHQKGAPPGVQQQLDYSAEFRFADPDSLMLYDAPTGRWLTYYRQR